MQDFRIGRLCEAARRQGVDCLVASSVENISYLTGGYTSVGQTVSASTQNYAVLSVEQKAVSYVASVADVPNILEFAGLGVSIYCYGPFHFAFTADGDTFVQAAERICANRYATAEEALVAAVQAAGNSPAFDETHIHFSLAGTIAEKLGVAGLTAASAIFREARRVKHPEEIQRLHESAQIAEAALLESLENARPGISEEELQLRYQQAVIRRGAIPYFFVATAARRAAYVDAHNTGLVIQKGDMIRFDFGCIWRGFYSDLARTAVMGQASPEIAKAYGAVAAGAKAMLDALRPGIAAEKLFETAVRAVRNNGLPDYARSHCGHGIGLEGYDVPSLAAGVTMEIEENMVLCVETPYYRIGWGGVQIEHTVAVTKDGFAFMDSGDSSLIVIPC